MRLLTCSSQKTTMQRRNPERLLSQWHRDQPRRPPPPKLDCLANSNTLGATKTLNVVFTNIGTHTTLYCSHCGSRQGDFEYLKVLSPRRMTDISPHTFSSARRMISFRFLGSVPGFIGIKPMPAWAGLIRCRLH